jgi:prevent-host-death family protein
MQTVPLSEVKDQLSKYVDAVQTTHEQVTITKNGTPAAILVGMDEWESLQETLHWLSKPGVLEDLARSRREIDEGDLYTEEQIRAEFNVPRRDR